MDIKKIAETVLLILILLIIFLSMDSLKTDPPDFGENPDYEYVSGVRYMKGVPETIENIVVVHSFPTNSILLNGLIEYLSSFFKGPHRPLCLKP